MFEMYTNNTIRVKINNNTTKERFINQSVRYGCPLSPTLFNPTSSLRVIGLVT
jgi:hypothetical protein